MGSGSGGASGTSLAALGFGAAGTLLKGYGEQAADTYKSQLLEEQAQFGTTKATEVSGQLTQRLNQTLGNIDTIRAAAHTDPTSPTGAAVRGQAETVGDTQRSIEVGNIEMQSDLERQQAQWLQYAGSQAMLGAGLQAGGQVLGAVSTGAFSPLFPSFSPNIPGVTG